MDEKHPLSLLLEPRSIAVIGATRREHALGAILMTNLRAASFPGRLYAVNPKYDMVQGVRCFPNVEEIPAALDLAIIATPPHSVLARLQECAKAGVRQVIVLTADPDQQTEAARLAQTFGMRLLGPNSLGVACPRHGLNATFALSRPRPGPIALVTQSGALAAALLDAAEPVQAGFSAVIALGASIDIEIAEVLDYLAEDPATGAILVYLEGLRDARTFLSALRAATRNKPVIVLKPGRHAAGTRAALAHTGLTGGDDAVFEAALRRGGALRVANLAQFFNLLTGLTTATRPAGQRLAILSNGGGPSVLAADRASDLGLRLAPLDPATLRQITPQLASTTTTGNPLDLRADLSPRAYTQSLALLLDDPNVDAVLCLFAPLATSHPTETARQVAALHRHATKPIVACWLGGAACQEAREIFRQAGIASPNTPESAIELFCNLSAWQHIQQAHWRVPPPLAATIPPLREQAQSLLDAALAARRTILHRHEAAALLTAFHIPSPPTRVVDSAAAAVTAACALGFPVSLHPATTLLGTPLQDLACRDLADPAALQQAYAELQTRLRHELPTALADGLCIEPSQRSAQARRLRLRVWRDPVFGPVIGLGASASEAAHVPDCAIALPPLTSLQIRDLLRDAHAERLLGPREGMPAADFDALERALHGLSALVCELPMLRSLEIDPLCVDERGVLAAAARIEIGRPPATDRRYAHLAIHPCPSAPLQTWQADGQPGVTLRPLRPEDAHLKQTFVRKLSPETRHFRYLSAFHELPPALLARLTQLDYAREMAYVASVTENGQETLIGVSRFSTNPDGHSGSFAIVVADAWQHLGLGQRLFHLLVATARQYGLRTLTGEFLASNERMLRFAERQGFSISGVAGDKTLKQGILDLGGMTPPLDPRVARS